MNSLINRNGEYVGQYLRIKDNEFSIKMFTKFYNLATHDNNFLINPSTTKDLIHIGKYFIKGNTIYANDLDNEYPVLKSLKIGDYMVFIQDSSKIYILNENEFKTFLYANNYESVNSIIYVLGIDNGVEFDNMRIIAANNLETAKNIYMKRYDLTDEPVCIGIIEKDHLNIISDKYRFEVPVTI